MQSDFTIAALLAAAVAVVLAPRPALAAGGTYDESDGVIQLSQIKAEIGGHVPGDAPGFPITISQPGSYRLQGNLAVTDPTRNAIEITSNDVTIDLAGFRITGPVICLAANAAGIACTPNTGSTAGVVATGRQFVAVRNGSIRGFGYGVRLGNHARVESLHVGHSAANGIASGRASQIAGNTIYMAGYVGISADGVVRDNAVQMVKTTGILSSNGSLVSGNRVSETGGYGIASGTSGKASLAGNSLWGTGGLYGVLQSGANACNGEACP